MRTAGLLAVLLAVAVSSSSAGPFDLPTPTGTYPVGRRVLRLRDDNRREDLSANAGDKREVGLWIWYPAGSIANSARAPYVADLNRLATALTADELSLLRMVVTHAFEDAPVANTPAPFPVVLFSPGNGVFPVLYTAFAEELASHGFVVAVIDHPYDSKAVLLSDGRVANQAKEPAPGEALLQYQRQRVTVRQQDLRFALDHLSHPADGSPMDALRGHLDLSHVGVAGHSVGGMAAAESCIRDARVAACANFDGVVTAVPAYLDSAGRGPQQPFLFVEKPLATVPGESAVDAARRIGFLRDRGNAALASVRTGRSYRVTVTGATHATFSDEEVLTGGSRREQELLGFCRAYLVAFFEETLKSIPASLWNQSPDSAIHVDVFSPP